MTIYTDQVTGKQYHRVFVGVAGKAPFGLVEGDASCRGCAFSGALEHGEECDRASVHCASSVPGKTVFFVFKERKA